MSQTSNNSTGDISPSAPQDPDYPPQHHAGAVGLGPEFAKGASIDEKVDGLKQEIVGKIKRDPELVEHGRDLRTGELKRKKMREDHGAFGHPTQINPDEAKHQEQEENAGQERPDTTTTEKPEEK
ncbi:hypothetical protein BJ322DRAFT_1106428 [Thelephora terrestris]|uniref:Uncharacterized protein n=1 Tax=Thelephora terrestris TaxID=56493 RepID=A0A9P6L9U2_9AGAM|nr:hypothetical protein BJ322DRAFT_1106428 [Thelephora terrestris]